MTLSELYKEAGTYINDLIRKEHAAQGHTLTGETERSLEFKISQDILSGYAVDYAIITDKGLRPDEISWKMMAGMIKYFGLRGLGEADAKKAAFFTIRKWMVEGMSTEESKQYSKTGKRQDFISDSLKNVMIDDLMLRGYDSVVDNLYNIVKSETI